MLARRSAARRTYASKWSFPGGHVESGESLDQALCRELHEEIGVTPLEYVRIRQIADPLLPNTAYHMYAVTKWTGNPSIRDDEHSELKWFALAAATSVDDLALEDYRSMFADLGGR